MVRLDAIPDEVGGCMRLVISWMAPMSGIGEDNALQFVFGMATGVALLWLLVGTTLRF